MEEHNKQQQEQSSRIEKTEEVQNENMSNGRQNLNTEKIKRPFDGEHKHCSRMERKEYQKLIDYAMCGLRRCFLTVLFMYFIGNFLFTFSIVWISRSMTEKLMKLNSNHAQQNEIKTKENKSSPSAEETWKEADKEILEANNISPVEVDGI